MNNKAHVSVRVDISAELHRDLKLLAIQRMTNLKSIVVQALEHERQSHNGKTPALTTPKAHPTTIAPTPQSAPIAQPAPRTPMTSLDVRAPDRPIPTEKAKAGYDWCRACGIKQVKLPGLLCDDCK